jgi:DNA-binding response OmpR family regulator
VGIATRHGHNRRVRLLLVEDDVDLATAVATGLASEGYEVDVSNDGADGLWRAREHAYAAIVLDILLPGMNGYRVCEALRADGNSTPILMLTAKSGVYDEAEALDTGADDFLAKPFAFVVLLARLRALLRRSDTARSPVLRVGSLTLDPARRMCTREGQSVPLTPREFSLLHELMRHPDEVVRRADLLDRVWGPDYPADSNVVEVYVRYLRKKLDEPFGRSDIHTVRGVGYRLLAPHPIDGREVVLDGDS